MASWSERCAEWEHNVVGPSLQQQTTSRPYARFSLLSLCASDMSSLDYDPHQLLDLLPVYYRRIFPAKLMCQWLAYGQGM